MTQLTAIRTRVPLLAIFTLLCSASIVAAQTDDQTIVIRQDALLQRMAMSFDGKVVATVGVTHDGSTFNSTVKLWDAWTGKLIRALDEEKDSHLELAFSRDYLAIGVNGKLNNATTQLREVRLLDPGSFEVRQKIDKELVPGVTAWTALAFSSDGRRLAAAGRDKAAFVKVWHIGKDRLIARDAAVERLPNEVSEVRCLVFSRDGLLVAAGCDDARIRLFSGLSGELRATLEVDANSLFGTAGIDFAPDRKTLASAGSHQTVLLWDLAERKPRKVLEGHEGNVFATAFSPDGRLLASGSRPGHVGGSSEVSLWDANSGELKQTIADLIYPVNVLAFSPEGKTLAICLGGADEVGPRKYKTAGEVRLVRLE